MKRKDDNKRFFEIITLVTLAIFFIFIFIKFLYF